ncbi:MULTISPECIES: hypothetical protein [Candidatus Nitrosocaldus]|jgi:hypothetical protein|uniref:Uncharacterized protein n=1 Tax=Candidatus Nitrosocaldus cavascurensis TaxID=2058097 RepID=A0A2K5APZ0_9ARCH|nr:MULTISPECIES: hypothetical protein [Candidatus Nitrosocaldus]SPC33712.1 conserved protein of unknown function [Candidatus Nitrosocaldus cavascurensis]
MDAKSKVRDIIAREVGSKSIDTKVECFACHVMYTVMRECNMDEATADLLSQVLSEDSALNERFIQAIEYLHLYSRARALWFYSKDRVEKDAYLAMHVRNAIAEIEHEAREYGNDTVLRRLLLSYLSTYIAQVIGMDLHASTEELYYMLRKNGELEEEIKRILRKIITNE